MDATEHAHHEAERWVMLDARPALLLEAPREPGRDYLLDLLDVLRAKLAVQDRLPRTFDDLDVWTRARLDCYLELIQYQCKAIVREVKQLRDQERRQRARPYQPYLVEVETVCPN
jgi:hypothetical protein